MANLGTSFVTDEMPASTSYEVLPAGWYTAMIGSVDIKQTKSGTGRYFAIRYNITGPTHEGRVVFSNINFENANPKAEEIGRQQLRGLMEAIGIARLNDSDQLIGGHVKVKLKVEKDEQYGDKNQVTGFASAGAAPPSAPKAAAASPAPKSSSAPPWAR